MEALQLIIDRIEVYQSPIKLKEPFVISLGPLEYAQNLMVVIRTREGLAGFGECSPFMTINGESMETGFVVSKYLAQMLLGQNPLDIAACSAAMDRVIYGNSSVKSAFDMALYDIAAKHAGVPLYEYLGGHNHKTLMTDYTVSLGSIEKMVSDALKIKAAGFKVIKVKLGENGEQDVKRIHAIREAIGLDIPLRLDANQGWGTDEAIRVLQALEPLNIQFCEEPIPRWNYTELSKIKEQCRIPVMGDESCCDHNDAKRLIDLKACDMFNIKLGKSSGIFKALKIKELAEQNNMPLQVGGFLESRLGFTASAHFALAGETIVFNDFDTPLMLEEDPVIGGISYGENGKVTVPQAPGLGLTVDPVFLKKQVSAVFS
ncbi:dipeptide epimerase [Maribellus sp. YY47]|uniref:mandelate racemase/muconate lactonizing enzyme family protein n=1 Tax=Maribellus sp. YY47 TaxID=2929486 RepID=UPI002000EC92|nr:dipeptide epimerase [Maribellus sp. YY47]MCK3685329.1 dipeptide epimerase [Maribellus sp. YY47]